MTPSEAASRAAQALDAAEELAGPNVMSATPGLAKRAAVLVQTADGWTRLAVALAQHGALSAPDA
jgi:hypothetical protein